MTPEQEAKLNAVFEWMQAEGQKVRVYPINSAGLGNKPLTQTVVDSHGDTSTVPAAYSGTVLGLVDGVQREFPFL